MRIIDFYYDEGLRIMFFEFSTWKDGDNFYRSLQMDYDTINYYSPNVVDEDELTEVDESFALELLDEYFKENDLPDPESL